MVLGKDAEKVVLRYRISRKERIAESEDFKRVMRFGKRVSSRNLRVCVKENAAGVNRFGVVVRKEVGGAAYRNRVKRFCREFFRLHKHEISGSVDMIFIAKKTCSWRGIDRLRMS